MWQGCSIVKLSCFGLV